MYKMLTPIHIHPPPQIRVDPILTVENIHQAPKILYNTNTYTLRARKHLIITQSVQLSPDSLDKDLYGLVLFGRKLVSTDSSRFCGSTLCNKLSYQ